MRSLFTTLGLLTLLFVTAQDWALINPTSRYNYSNDGTDTIRNHIRVLETEAWGADGFRYKLNPIARQCAPCVNVPPMCDQQAGLYTEQPQFLGLSVTVSGSAWTLYGLDTLLVQAGASVGGTWVATTGVQATVTSTSEIEVLSVPDSVKQIDLSNGVSVMLSKAHGIVAYATGTDAYTLVGVQGAVNSGARFPRVIDLFDYQPGDILQYRGTENGTDGWCVHYANYRNKYVVLSRTDLLDRTTYALRSLRNYQYYSTPIAGTGGCAGGGASTSEDTVQLVVHHDGWTPGNFLGSSWLNQLWPQAFAEPHDESEFAGEFASNYAGSHWRAYLDDAGRYVCEPATLGNPQTSSWHSVMACDIGTTYWPIGWDEIIGRYVEGTGFTYGSYLGFEHFSEKILEAYVIRGEEYGTLTPDDIILNVVTSVSGIDRSLIRPNPASEVLTLSPTAPGTSYRVIDTQGRAVLTGKLSASQLIDVRTLSTGSYLLLQEGFAPERFMIIR